MADPAIAPIALTGLLTLSGVVVGKTWDVLTDSLRWKREQRAASYAGFIAASEAVFLEMAQTVETFSRERLHERTVEMTQFAAQIDVFGSEQVARSAHRMWNYAALELTDEELLAMRDEQWAAASNKYRDLLAAFRDVARQDLKGRALGDRTSVIDRRGD